VVHEKDLGTGHRGVAAKMKSYDPDKTWSKVK